MKNILVVGSHSPRRTVALGVALRQCVVKRGWGERIWVAWAGLDGGAGPTPAAEIRALREAGFELETGFAENLIAGAPQRAPLGVASAVVADEGDVAQHLLGFSESRGKQIYCLRDFCPEACVRAAAAQDIVASASAWGERDDLDEVLRNVIAGMTAGA